MKKTPWGRACDVRLTAINDQLCFGAFASKELNRTIAARGPPKDITAAAAFPSNPHAARIDRRLVDLPQFEQSAVNTLCASALIAASEHIQEAFRTSRAELRRLTNTSAQTPIGGEDEKLKAQLTACGAPVVDEIFETVVYLRLRRNRLVHEGPLNATWQQYFAQGAGNLERFWSGRPTNLLGFDFHNPQLGAFRVEDGYAMMNLFRICQNTIDGWVAACLPARAIAEGIAKRLIREDRGLRHEVPRLMRKTRALLELEFGGALNAQELENAARAAR